MNREGIASDSKGGGGRSQSGDFQSFCYNNNHLICSREEEARNVAAKKSQQACPSCPCCIASPPCLHIDNKDYNLPHDGNNGDNNQIAVLLLHLLCVICLLPKTPTPQFHAGRAQGQQHTDNTNCLPYIDVALVPVGAGGTIGKEEE